MNISGALKFLAVPALVCIYVGCSPVNFTKDEELNRCQNSGKNCITLDGWDHFEDPISIREGLVDVLIVNDNSASMSFEQTQLAARLSGFVQKLEDQKADYRIAITTTDISNSGNPARAINQSGALQDGRLIKFPNGEYFLTKASGTLQQKDTWFKQTLQRPETASCELFIKNNYGKAGYDAAYSANCPSGDERGIYAANMVVRNNPNSFIRKDAHLAIIVLADEDERSQLYWYNQQNPGTYPGFDLEALDQPQALVSASRAAYGGGKLVSIHSMIVLDENCKRTQGNQLVVNGLGTVSGSYGLIYKQASDMTRGVVGDICSSDYTSKLGEISTNILDRKNSVPLACSNPSNLQVTISAPGITYSVSGSELKFSAQLPAGTVGKVKYSCKSL
ncbi:hypothetical protein [Bdellovibrio sp. HCB337]|uniref:hypothetical protein n=1 Tax=Bdellovibrio sp. HCB337 TaxID=3394358 RepID=UPI0039A77B90